MSNGRKSFIVRPRSDIVGPEEKRLRKMARALLRAATPVITPTSEPRTQSAGCTAAVPMDAYSIGNGCYRAATHLGEY
jgi:hypothetical protein